MKEKIKNAVEEYQCPGCVCGGDISCYESIDPGCGCSKHGCGTIMAGPCGTVSIFLGMPTGFNRIGIRPQNPEQRLKIYIFETLEIKNDEWDTYNQFNFPVWVYVKDSVTFIRGLMPRNNIPFLHVILEDLTDKKDFQNCYILNDEDLAGMD